MEDPREFEVCVSRNKLDVKSLEQELPDIPWELDRVRLESAQVLSAFTSRGAVLRAFETSVLGSNLYELLFSKIDITFQSAFRTARKEGRKLRVVLRFTADSGPLPHLPWEFLYVPRDRWNSYPAGFFVAANTDLILCRQISPTGGYEERGPRVNSDVQQALHILLVVSSPPNEKTVDAGDLVKLLQSWQDESEVDDVAVLSSRPVVFEQLLNPTKQELAAKVGEKPGWDIVHFCGHGRFKHQFGADQVSSGEVQADKEQWVSDGTFAQTIRNDTTELVFMQACESAKSDEGHFGGFCGLAPVLLSHGVPSVIAMQYEIKNVIANTFAMTFYKSLRDGETVDRAVQNGRMALATGLGTENFITRDFGSPVVYVGRTGMSFFDRPPDPARGDVRAHGRGPGRAAAQGLPTMPGMTAQRTPRDRRGAAPIGQDQCPTVSCPTWLPVDARWCDTCETEINRCPHCGRLIFKISVRCRYCAEPIQPAAGSSAGLAIQG